MTNPLNAIYPNDAVRLQAEALSEKQFTALVQEAFEEVLDHRGLPSFLYYHTHRSDRSPAGFPDIVAVSKVQGRTVYAELKRQAKIGKRRGWIGRPVLSLSQETWLHSLRTAGNKEVYLWTPIDWFDGTIATIIDGSGVYTPQAIATRWEHRRMSLADTGVIVQPLNAQ